MPPLSSSPCTFCLLHFCQAVTRLPATAVPVLQLAGQEAVRCGRASAEGTWGMQRTLAELGMHHLPCTGRLPEACTCHLLVHGVMAQGTCSPSVRACTEHTRHAFHLPVGKVDACLRLPGIRHINRAVVRTGEWSCSSLFTCAKFLGEEEEHVEDQPQRQLKCTDLSYIYTCCIQAGLSPRYINSPIPGGTARQHRDLTAPLAAGLNS